MDAVTELHSVSYLTLNLSDNPIETAGLGVLSKYLLKLSHLKLFFLSLQQCQINANVKDTSNFA